MQYNDEMYKDAISKIVNDAFYVEGLSTEAKIAQIRKYSEIVLRRLLNYPADRLLTIGSSAVKQELRKKGFTEDWFNEALEIIRIKGNDRTHTAVLSEATQGELLDVESALLHLYGYLFYKYFKKYTFGTNDQIMHAFSLLPPYIRLITLSELFKDDSNNINVIDKLALAKVKAEGKEKALAWLEENRELISRVNVEIPKEYQMFSPVILSLYDSCLEKIYRIGDIIEKQGPLYKDLESAIAYYQENGIVDGDTEEIHEFNQLMEFVYCGRKAKDN